MRSVTKVLISSLVLSLACNAYLLLQFTASSPHCTTTTLKNHAPNIRAKAPNSAKQATELLKAKDYFSQREFDLAIQNYAVLIKHYPQQAEQLYSDWLAHLKHWLTTNKLSIADEFLRVFLNRHPYDISMLKMNAERLVKSQQPHQAIVALYNLKPLADNTKQHTIIIELKHLAQLHVKTLSEQQAWQELIEKTTIWLDYDSSNSYYLLAQANAFYQLDDYINAQNSLDRLNPNHPLKSQATQLQNKINQIYAEQAYIPLTKYGAHYLVDITVNNNINTQLMIDTGASTTVLPHTLIDSLYPTPDYLGSITVNTANGKALAQHYRIESIKIGQHILTDFNVLAIRQNTGHGLLGMNFLQHFKFNINQQTNKLELVKL